MPIRMERRYAIVAAAFAIQAVVIGGMFAYGVFFKVLEAEFGWSRTVLSSASSVAFIVMGVFAIVGGRLNDRYGPRLVMSASGVLFGLAYCSMVFIAAPWQLLVCFGVLLGLGLSTHDVVTLSTVARWFRRRVGLISAVVKVGTACGQIVIPLGATALIAAVGWRSAGLALGVAAALVLVLAAQVLRRSPPDLLPDRPAPGGAQAAVGPAAPAAESGIGLRAALRTRQLWILGAAQCLFLPSLVTIPVHLPAHGMDLGMTAPTAAALLSAIGAVSILGRLFFGAASDRIGGRLSLAVCFAVLCLSLLLLRFADQPWMLYGFTVVYGLAHGGFFTIVSPTIAEYFGLSAHGAIFGVVLFCGTLGGAIGPMATGRVFDATGSYDTAFLGLALMAAAGLALVLALRPLPGDPDRQAASAPST